MTEKQNHKSYRGSERRRIRRVPWNYPAMIEPGGGAPAFPCVIANITRHGAKLVRVTPNAVPDELILAGGLSESEQRCRVVWRSDSELGVTFLTP